MRTQTLMAVEAFEAVERATLALEKKEAELRKYHVPEDDMQEYYRVTEGIRKEFESKREKVSL